MNQQIGFLFFVISLILWSKSFRINRIIDRLETNKFFFNVVDVKQSSVEYSLRKNEELFKRDPEILRANNADGIALKKLMRPEVLAPAGGWPQMKAAVANGADAVYFGLQDGFNARARANNFAADELDTIMTFLHERGVRGYVAVNILVFDNELDQLANLARKMAAAGVDALIVQDIGAVELIRRIAPNLPIHGSTQMSITDAKGASFAQSLGVERVVVGRELSISDIDAVSKGSDVEVEAFVHGALCVSYSGQCFSSEAWGGRSANRGQCAQACRMPYGLIVNGTLHNMEDMKYLLSPQDLMALDLVPELIRAGVGCFKIEGRLKGAEYVALTTRAYRDAVDRAWSAIVEESDGSEDNPTPSVGVDEAARRDLSQVFARGQDEAFDGLTPGFLLGPRHQSLVRGRNPRHRGVLVSAHDAVVAIDAHLRLHTQVGRVEAVQTPSRVLKSGGVVVRVRPSLGLKRGDGVVFDRRDPESDEEGGIVYDILQGRPGAWRSLYPPGDEASRTGGAEESYMLAFGSSDAVDLAKVSVGDLVWRTKDSVLESRLRHELKVVEGGVVTSSSAHLVGVRARVSGGAGRPFTLTLADSFGRNVTAESEALLQVASDSSKALNLTYVSEKIGVLGGTPLILQPWGDGNLVDFSQLDDGLFIPYSQIKQTRRKAVDALMELRRLHSRADGIRRDEGLVNLVDSLSSVDHPNSDAEVLGSNVEVRPWNSESSPRVGTGTDHPAEGPELSVLCRTAEQVAAVVHCPWLREVVLDFLEAHGLREAVQLVQRSGKRCVVATPRVIKPDERRLWLFYLRLMPDALLLRSAGLLQQMNEFGGAGSFVPRDVAGGASDLPIPELRGDFSLNAANSISTASFLQNGLSRLTPTHDLNAYQICDLTKALSPVHRSRLEVLLHQHLPIFHTEHCVFCRFMSNGNSYRDCGKPCQNNSVSLRDMNGADHLVLADMGCRNTIFNAQAQSGARYLSKFLRAGVARYRIELVDEPGQIGRELVDRYHELLQGLSSDPSPAHSERAVDSLWQWLESVPNAYGSVQGVSSGSLLPTEEKDRSQLKPTAKRN